MKSHRPPRTAKSKVTAQGPVSIPGMDYNRAIHPDFDNNAYLQNHLRHCLTSLKRRAPFESFMVEQGYVHTNPRTPLPECYNCCFDLPDGRSFFLHAADDGIHLNMPLYGSFMDIDDVTALQFMTFINGMATVTRFFELIDGYVQADAVFHGRFNRKSFGAFLGHWREDIEPIPLVNESALKEWHQIRMAKTGGIS